MIRFKASSNCPNSRQLPSPGLRSAHPPATCCPPPVWRNRNQCGVTSTTGCETYHILLNSLQFGVQLCRHPPLHLDGHQAAKGTAMSVRLALKRSIDAVADKADEADEASWWLGEENAAQRRKQGWSCTTDSWSLHNVRGLKHKSACACCLACECSCSAALAAAAVLMTNACCMYGVCMACMVCTVCMFTLQGTRPMPMPMPMPTCLRTAVRVRCTFLPPHVLFEGVFRCASHVRHAHVAIVLVLRTCTPAFLICQGSPPTLLACVALPVCVMCCRVQTTLRLMTMLRTTAPTTPTAHGHA